MAQNQIIDPATGEVFVWQVNDSEVEADVRSRSINHLQPAAAGWETVRPVRQQGDSANRLRRFTGLIASVAQHEALLRFWKTCESQTLHMVLYTGERYEILIRSYEPGRRRVIQGPHGARGYVWRYTMEIEIVTTVSP